MLSFLAATFLVLQQSQATIEQQTTYGPGITFVYVSDAKDGPLGEVAVGELKALKLGGRGFMRLKAGPFVSLEGDQPPIIFSPHLDELRRLDMAEHALKGMRSIPKDEVFPLSRLGQGASDYVLDYLTNLQPLAVPLKGQLPPNTLCVVSSTMKFEFTDGEKTVSDSFRESSLNAGAKDRDQRREVSAELGKGAIWAPAADSPELKKKWDRLRAELAQPSKGYGIDIRFNGSIHRQHRISLHEASLNRYSLLVKKRRDEVSEIAQPFVTEMSGRFSDLHSVPAEASFSQFSSSWQRKLKDHFAGHATELGFSSEEEDLRFLESSRLTKNSTAGLEIIVRLMPQGGSLVVPLWPQEVHRLSFRQSTHFLTCRPRLVRSLPSCG